MFGSANGVIIPSVRVSSRPLFLIAHRDMSAPSRFGQQIRRLRVAAGLTVRDLSTRAGMREAYLVSIEDGRDEPTAGALKRLACELETAGASYHELASLLISPEMDPTGEYARTADPRTAASTVPHGLKQIYEQWSTERLVRTLGRRQMNATPPRYE